MVKTKKPQKQRKNLYTAPKHKKQKLVSAQLDLPLQTKYGRRSLPVRKGDKVEIMRGDFKGFRGDVVGVDQDKISVFIDGVTIEKVDGSEMRYPIHPSNLRIVKLELEDDERNEILERSGE